MATIAAIARSGIVRWMMAMAWTLLICVLLLQPEADPIINLGLPSGPQTLAREAIFGSLHIIAFGITCGVWHWAWRAHFGLRASLALSVLIALALGVSTEALQSLSPDRYPSWLDLGANVVGVLLAARLIWQRERPR